MKVLVTGASGYLGGRLCHALLRHGYVVRAFVRHSSDLSCLPPVGSSVDGALELAYGDLTDYPAVLAACDGCQVVFHVAALVEPWLPDPSRFLSVNVGGLRNVLQAVKETKTMEKIIYTSSFFALGSTDGYVADESQIHPEKFFCTEYERSKVVADKIALQAASEGSPIVAVYPGVIYGPGKVTTGNIVARLMKLAVRHLPLIYRNGNDTSRLKVGYVLSFQLIERFSWRLPGYVGYGNDRCSFSHVDDVVEGQIAAVNKGRLGERYLLTGENASFKDVFDIAASITGTKKPWFNIPMWAIDVYGWLSVIFARITGKLPLISPPAVQVLKHQWAYSCEKAKVELGYNPRSLKEGLADVLAWLKTLKLINY